MMDLMRWRMLGLVTARVRKGGEYTAGKSVADYVKT